MPMTALRPPELEAGDIEARIDRLLIEQQEAVRQLGQATLQGLPGIGPRRELGRIREELEALNAALDLLEAR